MQAEARVVSCEHCLPMSAENAENNADVHLQCAMELAEAQRSRRSRSANVPLGIQCGDDACLGCRHHSSWGIFGLAVQLPFDTEPSIDHTRLHSCGLFNEQLEALTVDVGCSRADAWVKRCDKCVEVFG